MHALLLTIVLTAAPPEFRVQTLDDRTVTGSITALDAKQVTVRTSAGPVSLRIDELLAVFAQKKPTPPPNETPDEPTIRIELVDGSSLTARAYSVRDGRAQVTLLDGQAIDVPVSGVAVVRLQQQSEQLAADWVRILDLEVETDLLVVRKDEAIDYHRGLLRDVTEAVVNFELEGEVLPVKRSKIHALVYYRPPTGKLPPAVCRLVDGAGSQWSVRSLAGSDDLTWTTCGGVTMTRPMATIAQLDFSRGKVVFLGDLRPESTSFTPFFGSGENTPLLARFHAPRVDGSLESGPLRLNKKEYGKGIALHSRTKVVYRLPDRFRRFEAIVGIDDAVRPQGNVRLVISGDDKVLLEATVTGTDPPKPIALDLTGVRRLSVLVDFGTQLDVADHLDLCEARIIK